MASAGKGIDSIDTVLVVVILSNLTQFSSVYCVFCSVTVKQESTSCWSRESSRFSGCAGGWWLETMFGLLDKPLIIKFVPQVFSAHLVAKCRV
jgi:hypothetical protein